MVITLIRNNLSIISKINKMKYPILVIFLFVFTNLNAQLFVGYNFNFFEKNKVINIETNTNYYGFEIVSGYKLKTPFSVKLSYYMWSFEKNKGSLVPRIPDNTTKIDFHTIPLTISRQFYLKEELPIYLNFGIQYSTSFGIDNIETTYLSHGPGFDICATGEFGIHMFSVGTRENFEIFGYRATNRHKRAMYISWHVIFSKKWITTAIRNPITK